MFDDIVFGSKWVHLLLFLHTFYGLFRVVWAFQGEYRAKAIPFTVSKDYHQLHLKRVSFTKKLWIAKVHIKPQKLLSNVVTPSLFL